MNKVIALIFGTLLLITAGGAMAGSKFGDDLNDVWSFGSNAQGTWEVIDFSATDVDGPGTPSGPATPLITSKATPDTEELEDKQKQQKTKVEEKQ